MGSICSKQPLIIKNKPQTTNMVTEYSKTSDFRKKYKFIKILGNGSFGKVRWYEDRQTVGSFFAIKTLEKLGITPGLFQCLKEETSILSRLDHPNIVKYYETFEDDCYLHIVMEYLSGDNLYSVLSTDKSDSLTELQICNVTKQIIKAWLFIHNKGIVHRDIKPENILFRKTNDYSSLKLIDFGLSTSTIIQSKMSVGSPYYMAPEIIQGKYSSKTDMWSVGVIMHLMWTGKFPFTKNKNSKEEKSIFINILNDEFDTKYIDSINCSEEGKDWVKKLLIKDEKKRISTEEAINHPWFIKFRRERKSLIITGETLQTLRDFGSKSAWQKEILFFIAKITNESEIIRLRDLFNVLDVNNSGNLSIEDIRKTFTKIGWILPEEEVKEIWKGLDFHQDGMINYTEFIAAMISSYKFTKEEKVWAAFKYFQEHDSNEDGVDPAMVSHVSSIRSDSNGEVDMNKESVPKKKEDIISVESLLKVWKSFNWNVNEKGWREGFEQMKREGKVLNIEEFKKLVL